MTGIITRRRFGAQLGGGLLGAGMIAMGGQQAWAASGGHHSFLVFSDPLPGQDSDYARWQQAGHVARMASVPGVVGVQRFVPEPIELRHAARKTPGDLTIYTIRSGRFDAASQEIARRGAMGQVWPSADCAAVQTYTYRSLRATTPGVGGEPQGAAPGTARHYTVLAFGDAIAGQEAVYDDWYDHVHQPELMAKPGVVGGTRDVLAEVQPGPGADRPRYLFTLDLLTSDLAATFHGILDGAGAPSPALDRTRGFGFTYRPV